MPKLGLVCCTRLRPSGAPVSLTMLHATTAESRETRKEIEPPRATLQQQQQHGTQTCRATLCGSSSAQSCFALSRLHFRKRKQFAVPLSLSRALSSQRHAGERKADGNVQRSRWFLRESDGNVPSASPASSRRPKMAAAAIL